MGGRPGAFPPSSRSILLTLTACAGPLQPPLTRPHLTKALPTDYRSAQEVFANRIAKTYPLPMPERDPTADLETRGFQANPRHSFATFTIPGLPCTEEWRVIWPPRQQQVTRIEGIYLLSCL